MHNKWGRRYKRIVRSIEYFEALARQAVDEGRVWVDIADGIEVRLRRRRRWLEFADSDGSVFSRSNVGDFRGEDLVHVIADYIMQWAANFPGVQVPEPSGSPSIGID